MYSVLSWVLGLLQHVGVVLLIAFLVGSWNTSPVLQVVLVVWCFNLAYHVWMYLEGLKINLVVSMLYRRYIVYSVMIVLLMPLFSLVEGWAATLGVLDAIRRKQGFVVISKGA